MTTQCSCFDTDWNTQHCDSIRFGHTQTSRSFHYHIAQDCKVDTSTPSSLRIHRWCKHLLALEPRYSRLWPRIATQIPCSSRAVITEVNSTTRFWLLMLRSLPDSQGFFATLVRKRNSNEWLPHCPLLLLMLYTSCNRSILTTANDARYHASADRCLHRARSILVRCLQQND